MSYLANKTESYFHRTLSREFTNDFFFCKEYISVCWVKEINKVFRKWCIRLGMTASTFQNTKSKRHNHLKKNTIRNISIFAGICTRGIFQKPPWVG